MGVADLIAPTQPSWGPGRLFTFVPESPNARTLDVYEHRADRYDATLGPAPDWHVAFLDRVAASLGAGAEVLELGSGTGDDARYLAGRGLAVQPSDGSDVVRRGDATSRALAPADRRPHRRPRRSLGLPSSPSPCCCTSRRTSSPLVLDRIHGAVRPRGALALSVKEGDGSAWSDHKLGLPRFFTYWRPRAAHSAAGRARLDRGRPGATCVPRDDWILVIATRRDDDGG